MNTRNVTNTAFTSYVPTGVELPNGRQLANSYDVLYRRTLVQDVTNGVNVAAWQFFGPSRVAEVNLANGLTCTWMNNARTHSAVQPTVANPAWGDQSSDRLGYDGAGRPITKRYLAGGLNGSNGYANPSAVVGFTTEYDLASNKFYERALHAEERSSLYEPFSNGSPTGGYDSLNRLRQYQRGVLTSDDGFAGNGGGSVVSGSSIALPNTDTQRTYDLDSLGNWRRTNFTLVSAPDMTQTVQEVRQHNGLNEITRIQDTNSATGISQADFSYDGQPGASNGNLANDRTRSYAWDALNRLVEVKRVSDGAVIGQYVYDALNRRIRKTIPDLGGGFGGLTGNIPAGTTDCIYSGWRCVEERNPFGESGDTPTIQYVWGIYLDELLQQFNIAAINGFSANVALYPLQDLLYRTTGLADSSGTVREAYDTDAYGNTLIFRNGSPPGPITWIDSGEDADTPVDYPTSPFIFTGQRFDPESQIYYYKWRFYIPAPGRFASRDVIAAGLNPFGYATNEPNKNVDPLGLQPSSTQQQLQKLQNAATFAVIMSLLQNIPSSIDSFMQLWSKAELRNKMTQIEDCKACKEKGTSPQNCIDFVIWSPVAFTTMFAGHPSFGIQGEGLYGFHGHGFLNDIEDMEGYSRHSTWKCCCLSNDDMSILRSKISIVESKCACADPTSFEGAEYPLGPSFISSEIAGRPHAHCYGQAASFAATIGCPNISLAAGDTPFNFLSALRKNKFFYMTEIGKGFYLNPLPVFELARFLFT